MHLRRGLYIYHTQHICGVLTLLILNIFHHRERVHSYTLIPLEVYSTYHTHILNISHLGKERAHTHTSRGVYLPYSYTWTRHTFPPRYGRAISYHRIHAQTKFRQTPPARGFSGSHIVRGFLRVFLDHFSEAGSSIWPNLALASFHAA